MENYALYDSDLNSENEEAKFESDHEPPKEQVHDKKAIYKSNDLKIYRTILQVGKGIPRPAKYDEIQYKMCKVEDESNTLITEELEKQETQTCNLGMNKHSRWFDKVLENVRKDEKCLITVKHISRMPNQDQKIQKFEYHQVHLIDWITVIDLHKDQTYLKKVLQKGEGHNRCLEHDEITFQYKLQAGSDVLQEKEFTDTTIEAITEQLPSNVLKVLKTMKHKEEVICTIQHSVFLKFEQKQEVLELVESKNPEKLPLTLEIKILSLFEVEDTFEDGAVLKKNLQKGVSTAKAEDNSEIFFNYRITDKRTNTEIYSSGPLDIDEEAKAQLSKTDTAREYDKCVTLYLDEYKVSRMLKNVLKRMKKMERASVAINNFRYIKFGEDYEQIAKHPDILSRESADLQYDIYLYYFVEGKNTFTMTMAEKMSHALRKKAIGVGKIKSGEFKKGLKVFENINAYFDMGSFTEEEKAECKQIHLSSMLNTSLAMLKLEQWKPLIQVVDKLLKLDKNNMKAVYRKAVALRKLQEHQAALTLLNDTTAAISNIDPERKHTDKQQYKELEKLSKQVELELKHQQKNEKAVFQKMFE